MKISFVDSKKLLDILDTYNVDRVVLGGGEPLLDPNLCSIVKLLKSYNVSIILLTNCHLLDNHIELLSLLDNEDTIVASIKCLDSVKHRRITGRSPKRALRNVLTLYDRCSASLKIETVFVPELVGVQDIVKLAEWIKNNIPDVELIVDTYIPVPGLPYRRPNEDDIRRLLKELSRINIRLRLRKSSQVQMQGRVIYNSKLAMFNFKTSDTVHLIHPTIPEDMLAPHT